MHSLRSKLSPKSSLNPNEGSKSTRTLIHELQRFQKKADGLYLTMSPSYFINFGGELIQLFGDPHSYDTISLCHPNFISVCLFMDVSLGSLLKKPDFVVLVFSMCDKNLLFLEEPLLASLVGVTARPLALHKLLVHVQDSVLGKLMRNINFIKELIR